MMKTETGRQSTDMTQSALRFNAQSDPKHRTQAALEDIGRGLRAWRFWTLIAWFDIKQRYRRTTLGPFWITISMGAMILVLGLIYGSIFQRPVGDYLVYLAAGIITWFFVSSTILESSTVFISAEGIIKQGSVPLSLHVFRVVWRNLIVLLHNVLVLIVVLFLFRSLSSINPILLVVGLVLLTANLTIAALLLSMVSARFRDIPQIVSSFMQVLFYITPILYEPSQLPSGIRVVANFNPLYHIIEVFRQPMIGERADLTNFSVALLSLVVGAAIAFLVFRRFRGRIAYWV